MQAGARPRLFWTLAVTAPALVSVASFGTLPVFVMEHISLSGKGDGPLGAAAADVAVGVLFGLAATLIIGHLRVALAHAVQPHMGVSSKYMVLFILFIHFLGVLHFFKLYCLKLFELVFSSVIFGAPYALCRCTQCAV